MWLCDAVICMVFYQLKPWRQLYPLAQSLWQVKCIPWDYQAISAKHSSFYAFFDRPGASAATLDPFSALVYNLRNVSGDDVSQILGHYL